jgi:hypothetical protein
MSINPSGPYVAFTSRFTGRSPRLTSEVEIFPAFVPATNGLHPPGQKFHALYDTGATNSAISPNVVTALNLPSIGAMTVGVGGGSLTTTSHLVNIGLPNKVLFAMVPVAKMVILGGVDALIGMDILGNGDFAVTHRDGNTVFSFCCPSIKEIDFVVDLSNLKKNMPKFSNSPARNAPCPCGSGKKYKGCHGR